MQEDSESRVTSECEHLLRFHMHLGFRKGLYRNLVIVIVIIIIETLF